jgi:hypothetical protein
MKITTINQGGVIGCIVISLLATGCSQSFIKHEFNAKARNMVPSDFDVVNNHPYTVALYESAEGAGPGSSITELIWDDDFIGALRISLAESHLFRKVTDSNVADYVLCVTIIKYDQPWLGADLNIQLKTKWELKQAKTDQLVWSDMIDSAYKVKFWNMPNAAIRAQLATEGSIRANIREGIRRLSMVKI